jgi:hypothetical protein
MKIKILGSASQDLIDGYWFYENQAEGVGKYFLYTLFSDIDSLEFHAGIHPIYFEKYHRLLSDKFPFAIYYRVENERVLVYSILDCRRDPAWTRDQLK